jgi:hypothetical protein
VLAACGGLFGRVSLLEHKWLILSEHQRDLAVTQQSQMPGSLPARGLLNALPNP